jgi:hypothetical protein
MRTAQLSPEEKAAAEAWFNAKMAHQSAGCPMCRTKNWTLLDHFVSPNNFTPGGGVMLGGNAYPHFMLACSNCGNTQFINAILAGVIPKG